MKVLIDTHWHFDHADNNENFRKAGAAVLAHENTRKRMTETHDLLGMQFPPAPAGALPTETFTERKSIEANGEKIEIALHPARAHRHGHLDPLHEGRTCCTWATCSSTACIPSSTPAREGTSTARLPPPTRRLKRADASTKIIPGHGPLGDRAALTKYRDMLVTVRDRVQKLKAAGRTAAEVVAANPTADLDATWGKGFMQAKDFVGIVYGMLK